MVVVKFIVIFAVSFGAFFATGEIVSKITDNGPIAFSIALVVGFSALYVLYKAFIGKRDGSTLNMISDAVSVVKDASDSVTSRINEKDASYYALAEHEINVGKLDQGLWSQALVKANGDEIKRKSEYIKLRVMQLKR